MCHSIQQLIFEHFYCLLTTSKTQMAVLQWLIAGDFSCMPVLGMRTAKAQMPQKRGCRLGHSIYFFYSIQWCALQMVRSNYSPSQRLPLGSCRSFQEKTLLTSHRVVRLALQTNLPSRTQKTRCLRNTCTIEPNLLCRILFKDVRNADVGSPRGHLAYDPVPLPEASQISSLLLPSGF